MRVILPEYELRRLYLKELYTFKDLANHFACSIQTVRKNLKHHRIPKRKRIYHTRKLRMSEEEFRQKLYDLYWNQALSTYKIADLLDLSQMCIWSHMKRMNIPRRPSKNQIHRKLIEN